jgi:Rrf2 family protein
MKLSTRSRYGFRAALELAVEYGKGPLQIKTMAEREGISNKYLEQIIAILKASGLVTSMRGPRGGYSLAKHPSEIKLLEIFGILEGPVVTVECVDHPEYCARCTDCVTRRVWQEMQQAMSAVLESKTLQTLVDDLLKNQQTADYQI